MKRTKVPFGVPLLTQGADSVWGVAIHRLTGTLAQKRAEGKFSQVVCDYIWLCFAELIRLRWDKNFQIKLPKELERSIAVSVRPAAEVLDLLFDFSIELWAAHPNGYSHPSGLLVDLLADFQAWGIATKEEGIDTATKFYRNLQAQNARLANYENPFSEPTTKALFDLAIDLANRNGRFQTTKYKRFIQERRAFTETLKPGHPKKPRVIQNHGGLPKLGKTRKRGAPIQTQAGQGFQAP